MSAAPARPALTAAADALMRLLGSDGLGYPGGNEEDGATALAALEERGLILLPDTRQPEPPAGRGPVTATAAAARAAGILAEAGSIARDQNWHPGKVTDMTAVAAGWRELAVDLATHGALRPDTEDTQ